MQGTSVFPQNGQRPSVGEAQLQAPRSLPVELRFQWGIEGQGRACGADRRCLGAGGQGSEVEKEGGSKALGNALASGQAKA